MSENCIYPLCDRKAVRDEFCFLHAVHFARAKIKDKPKPIAKSSNKRKDEEKLYKVKRKEYLQLHIRCEVKGCNKVSEDIHHRCGRIGKLLYDEKFFLAVCRDHHMEIEQNVTWAKENGYSISRLKK